MAKSKYENFEMQTVHRSQIKNAEYNPRFMGEKEKKRLKAALKENGLVSALTWNKRTGNLVGGHQRLKQLDSLEKNADYELTVCVIDVDEKQEAKLNVQLNNPSMQGDWDVEKLFEITQDFDLSMEEMGFTSTDAAYLFDGDEKFVELFETPEAQEEKGKLKKIKEDRQGMGTKYKDEQRADFMLMVVFQDAKERADFMRRIHVPGYEQYVTVEQIERIKDD